MIESTAPTRPSPMDDETETYQARLYNSQLKHSATMRAAIESERGTVSVTHGHGIARITVVDRQLRKTHNVLTIEAIDKLIEELKIARACLVYEDMLSELPRLKAMD
jgi:hypothetical protein